MKPCFIRHTLPIHSIILSFSYYFQFDEALFHQAHSLFFFFIYVTLSSSSSMSLSLLLLHLRLFLFFFIYVTLSLLLHLCLFLFFIYVSFFSSLSIFLFICVFACWAFSFVSSFFGWFNSIREVLSVSLKFRSLRDLYEKGRRWVIGSLVLSLASPILGSIMNPCLSNAWFHYLSNRLRMYPTFENFQSTWKYKRFTKLLNIK